MAVRQACDAIALLVQMVTVYILVSLAAGTALRVAVVTYGPAAPPAVQTRDTPSPRTPSVGPIDAPWCPVLSQGDPEGTCGLEPRPFNHTAFAACTATDAALLMQTRIQMRVALHWLYGSSEKVDALLGHYEFLGWLQMRNLHTEAFIAGVAEEQEWLRRGQAVLLERAQRTLKENGAFFEKLKASEDGRWLALDPRLRERPPNTTEEENPSVLREETES